MQAIFSLQEFRVTVGALSDEDDESSITQILTDAKPVCDKCHQTHAEHQLAKLAQKGSNKTPSKAKTAISVLKGLDEHQTKMVHPTLIEFANAMKA